jgi:hypothetical protein
VIYTESGIEIDLTRANMHEKHDAVNTVLSGVDFVFTDARNNQYWLEVKNWSSAVIPPQRRGGQRRSFLAKMNSRTFPQELRQKFLGTCTFLALTGTPPAVPIIYIMLLESTATDSALRSHMMTRMRSLLPRNGTRQRPWRHPVEVAVVSVAEWNARFPDYPARPI